MRVLKQDWTTSSSMMGVFEWNRVPSDILEWSIGILWESSTSIIGVIDIVAVNDVVGSVGVVAVNDVLVLVMAVSDNLYYDKFLIIFVKSKIFNK